MTFWGCFRCGAVANSPSGTLTWYCNCTGAPTRMMPLSSGTGGEVRLIGCDEFMLKVVPAWG